MAETHTKPEPVVSTTRCYTVSYASDAKYNPLPAVILEGRWLEEAGFATGILIEVKVLPDCLILSVKKQSPIPPEPEIMQTLRKVCKFSARKQRQVTELIEVISKPQR
ncbi:SymE family type I addiction module toxin [Biostraticola tofi]|uniref:Toxic protein SymE n=1 Tax=Biostraticola tofi TaxID=466109 RepID=A0A4R3YJ68_9GAMM|nr:SymE family type I addiction module toxin [Biostraticola tofi]TCV91044.1 toxic protein SymE [Biostraticola tofi]